MSSEGRITEDQPPKHRERLHVGNEIPPDRLYVVRPEDQQLIQRLRDRQWINIVAARTMGKSSMFDRAGRLLLDEGFVCVRSDLALDSSDDMRTAPDPVVLFEGQIRSWISMMRWRIPNFPMRADAFRESARATLTEHADEPDGERAWALLKILLTQADAHINPGRTTFVLAVDEVQFLARVTCATRFLRMIRQLTSLIAASDWHDRVVLCFIGWEPFGHFSMSAREVAQQIVHTHEIRDFNVSDEFVVESFCLAFESTEKVRRLVEETLKLTGGHPLVSCCALERVRRAIEFDGADANTPAETVHKKLIAEMDEFRRELPLLAKHMDIELKESPDARLAVELYGDLLSAPGFRLRAARRAGADTLCRVGLARRVTADEGEVVEIKSRVFAEWFNQQWLNDAKACVPYGTIAASGDVPGRVCLLTVGGTICMERPGGGKRTAFVDADRIGNYLKEAEGIPTVDVEHFQELDSINVHPIHWKPLVEKIAALLRETDLNGGYKYLGIVVAHGTDTLSFTASYAAFALHHLMNRPVVFTGSQVPLDVFDSDGPMNLYTACRVAMKGAELPETVVVFGRRILRAVQATKQNDFEYEGMSSPRSPELGVVSETVELYHERIRQPNWNPDEFKPPEAARRVQLIELMPGLEPELYEHALSMGLSGIILQTLGAGNVSDLEGFDFTGLVERAWHKFTVPVLVTSKVPVDPNTYTRYERGVKAIDKGAVPAMNMTPSAAAAKFRWVLADTAVSDELNRIRISDQDESAARRQLRELIWDRMRDDVAGETATEWELRQKREPPRCGGNA